MFDWIYTYWLPIFIGTFVFVLFLIFCYAYCAPAWQLIKQINSALSLDEIKNKDKSTSGANKITLDNHFFKNTSKHQQLAETLKHAWQTYAKTLHPQTNNIDGETKTIGYKATASSSYFFSHSLIVDTPLNVEFFKHLAGIMTGVGIIGTFGGLLLGLWQFDPAGDPANIQNSLALLLHGVRDAFIASGIAIFLAMLTVAIEKALIRKCYAKLEELTASIDSLFEADTLGEEYLERLVQSAQDSATQTKQLKDSLVSDLKAMMENLTAAQKESQQELARQLIEASAKNSTDMAAQIGQSITDSLQAPLEKLAGSVQQVSGDQGSAVQDLLTDVLTAFMDRLESTFGNQMNGMSEMMTQSVSAMREMQVGFNQLIGDMRSNSEASSKALEQQMLNMLTEIQQKQNEMGSTMNDMLDKVQQSVAQIGDTGAEAAQKMNLQIADMLSQINSNIGSMMVEIGEKQIAQEQRAAQNQQTLHDSTNELVNTLTQQVNILLQESDALIKSNRQTLEKLGDVSISSIKGMNDGAEKMRLAAERFSTAGQSLSSVTEGSSALLSQINTLSGNLTGTTNQLKTLITDYQQSRTSVDQAVQVLQKLIDTARQEAGMSSQMLADMQQMTQALQGVQQDMQQYLGQVNDVLAKGMDSFSSGVEATLNRSLLAFDNTLADAVSRLRSGVEDLGGVAEDLTDIVQRKARRS